MVNSGIPYAPGHNRGEDYSLRATYSGRSSPNHAVGMGTADYTSAGAKLQADGWGAGLQ